MKIFTLLLTSTVAVMAVSGLSPALPEISQNFQHLENGTFLVKLMLTLPAFFIAVSAPLFGYLSDLWGRRIILLIGIVVYGLSGTSGLYLDSIYLLLVTRALLGLAVGATMTATTALITDYYGGSERIRVMGLQSVALSSSGFILIFLTGFLANYGWRVPFATYALSIVIFILAFLFLTDSNSYQKTSTTSINTQDGFYLKHILYIYLIVFISMTLFYIIITEIPFFAKNYLGLSSTLIGSLIACLPVASAISSFLFKTIRLKLNYYYISMLMFFLMGIGFLILTVAQSTLTVFFAMLFTGLGSGFLIPTMNIQISAIVPIQKKAQLLGGLSSSIFLGQFFSPIFSEISFRFLSTPQLFLLTAIIMFGIALLFGGQKLIGSA